MLKNISVRFDPVEDRMVIRLAIQGTGQTEQHCALHVTRRVFAVWRQDLQTMLDLSAEVPQRLDAIARASVSRAHHDAMADQATTRTESATSLAETSPTPTLVTRIVCARRREDGRWLMRFERRGEAALGLVLSGRTMHALVDAVFRRLQVAQWGLASLPVEAKLPNQAKSGSPLH